MGHIPVLLTYVVWVFDKKVRHSFEQMVHCNVLKIVYIDDENYIVQ
jgi:hypothetical protein